jgi:crotonobetainyl-CoA:carnitine CoA-transferase CaiB-like acyl-CoA transferase
MNAEKTQTSGAGPLAGIVVVGLGRALAGPHAAMMLADLGARVIKVEAPGGGDDTRGWGPPFVDPESSRESTYFLSCNCNKESVVLDLKEAGDHAMLRAMLERADVLVENFRTGVMDRLGLDTGRLLQLNPRLVVLSLTGFGRDGPEGGRPGYDQIVQGEAGLMSLTGPGKPQKAGVPIADLLAGVYGALGVVAAVRVLEARKQSIAQRGRTARSRAGCETPELERGTPGSVTQPAWSALFWGNDVRPVKSGS